MQISSTPGFPFARVLNYTLAELLPICYLPLISLWESRVDIVTEGCERIGAGRGEK